MTLNQASWQYICEHYPVFAQNFLQEYQRCNGFIPYEPGFVYVIHAVGSDYYKIGKSVNPDRRLLQIAPQMPFRTRFVRVWPSYFMSLAEAELHRRHEEHRANGEWFELDRHDLASLLGFWSDEGVRYAYTHKINRILWVNKGEGAKFENEFGLSIFDPEVGIRRAINAVETLFSFCQEELDTGLPDDIKTIVDETIDQWNRHSFGGTQP